IENITSEFIGNYAFTTTNAAYGGAICNWGGSGRIAFVTVDGSTFEGNYAITADSATYKSAYGGAISTTTYACTNVFSSTFKGNYSYYGGAIYNDSTSTTTVADSTFTNNIAYINGGAIYNAGTLYIIADSADVLFEDNTLSDGTSNAIYNTGTVYLNAASNQNIDFEDALTGSNGVIYINMENIYRPGLNSSYARSDVLVSQTGGTVTINNTVTGNTLNLCSGYLALGENADITAVTLNVSGGEVSLADNTIRSTTLGTVNLSADMGLGIDVSLTDTSADSLTINNFSANSYYIVISTINLLSLTDTTTTVTVANETLRSYVKLSDNVSVSLADGLSTDNAYLISYDSSSGSLVFNVVTGGIVSVIADISEQKVYTMIANETPSSALGYLKGSSMTVSGGGKTLSGANNSSGIIVGYEAAPQSLGMNNLTITNYTTAITNYSGSTVALSDVTMTGNTTDVDNNGSLTFGGTSSVKTITGTGSTTVSGDLSVNSGGSFTQAALSILAGGSMSIDAANLSISDSIANSGTLSFNGTNDASLSVDITGAGTFNLSQNLTTSKSVSQYAINIAENVTLTLTGTDQNFEITGLYSNSGTISNAGAMTLGGENNIGTLTGTGSLYVTGYLTADKALTQSYINIASGSQLTNSAGITANIENAGTFINNASLTGTLINTGTTTSAADYLHGNVTNTGSLTLTGGSATAGTSALSSDNSLTLSVSILGSHDESDKLTSAGTLTISDYVTLADVVTIEASTITINVSSGLVTDFNQIYSNADDGTLLTSIVNNGHLYLSNTDNLVNNATITTTSGYLHLLGSLATNANITQNTIYLTSSDVVLTVNSGATVQVYYLSNSGVIANNGTLYISSSTSTGNITGSGTLRSAGSTNVASGKYIEQTIFNITGGTFTNNATGTYNDYTGIHIYYDDTIEGSGTVNLTGTSVLTNNQKLTADKGIYVQSSTASVTSNASNLIGAVYNAGTVNLTGGTTQAGIGNYTYTSDAGDTVSMNGTVAIKGDVTLAAGTSITGNNIELASGTLTVADGGVLTATDDSTVLTTTASGGALSTQNSTIDTAAVVLGNLVLASDLNLSIDVNLSTNSGDTITLSSLSQYSDTKTYNVVLANINIIVDSDAETRYVQLDTTDSSIYKYITLSDSVSVTNSSGTAMKYIVAYASETGILSFTAGDLYTAFKMVNSERTYTLTEDEDVSSTGLGEMGGSGTTMHISGEYSIKGSGSTEGAVILSGQTLTLSNVTMSGFNTALTNNGTATTVSGVTFSSNTTALINNSGGTVAISDTTFTGNTTDINNAGTMTISGTTVFSTAVNTGTMTISGTNTALGAITDSVDNLSGVLTLDGTFTTTNNISQKSVTIKDSSSLAISGSAAVTTETIVYGSDSAALTVSDSAVVTVSDTLTNSGTLTISDSAAVTVSNTLTNSGTLTISDSAVVSASSIVNNSGCEITAVASGIGGTVANAGTLTLTGGTLAYAVSGENGTTAITGAVVSSASIGQA
ncbi:MAG: hypothetical protein LUB59_05020, partial [Candidatus Gastranaerophilales bacterium]|nr:hypothetical protein [Candidatus Gastranaerophilales bacterium]